MMTIAILWFALLLFKAGFAWQEVRRPQPTGEVRFDGTTVVQPILSGDPALESVLESNLLPLKGGAFSVASGSRRS